MAASVQEIQAQIKVVNDNVALKKDDIIEIVEGQFPDLPLNKHHLNIPIEMTLEQIEIIAKEKFNIGGKSGCLLRFLQV